MMNFKAITLGAIALTLAPLTPAAAGSPYRGAWRGYHHFGLGGAVVSAIVGVLTLPLAIAAAAIDQPEYESPYQPEYQPPPPNYQPPANYYSAPTPYYPAPMRYYAPPMRYYARPGGYYVPRPRYDSYRAYRNFPRRGDYSYRR